MVIGHGQCVIIVVSQGLEMCNRASYCGSGNSAAAFQVQPVRAGLSPLFHVAAESLFLVKKSLLWFPFRSFQNCFSRNKTDRFCFQANLFQARFCFQANFSVILHMFDRKCYYSISNGGHMKQTPSLPALPYQYSTRFFSQHRNQPHIHMLSASMKGG